MGRGLINRDENLFFWTALQHSGPLHVGWD